MAHLKASHSGFTLIELLLGLSFWLLVSLSVLQIFRQGLRIWKRMEVSAPGQEEARCVLDQIAHDFRNAVDVPGVGWQQEDHRVTFAVARASAEPTIEKVSYSATSESASSYQCTRQRLNDPSLAMPKDYVIATRAKQITWEYAYLSEEGKILWRSVWLGDSLPTAVRVHVLETDGGGRDQDYARVIVSPVDRPFPRVL